MQKNKKSQNNIQIYLAFYFMSNCIYKREISTLISHVYKCNLYKCI